MTENRPFRARPRLLSDILENPQAGGTQGTHGPQLAAKQATRIHPTSTTNLSAEPGKPPKTFAPSGPPSINHPSHHHHQYNLSISSPTPVSKLKPLTPLPSTITGSPTLQDRKASGFSLSPETSEASISPALQSTKSRPAFLRPLSTASPNVTSSRRFRGRTRDQFRSSSAPGPESGKHTQAMSTPTSAATSGRSTPHPYGKPSVKHLTCFWWKEKGDCRFTEEQCLYAHHDTGLYADPPRQLVPGQPAVAGRALQKALNEIKLTHNRSSSSLASTPAWEHDRMGANSPLSMTHNQSYAEGAEVARLQSDNDFFRNLVEQAIKEKSVLISTAEKLQIENNDLKQASDTLQAENTQLTAERDTLRGVVAQLQQGAEPRRFFPNPLGAIGSGWGRPDSRGS